MYASTHSQYQNKFSQISGEETDLCNENPAGKKVMGINTGNSYQKRLTWDHIADKQEKTQKMVKAVVQHFYNILI